MENIADFVAAYVIGNLLQMAFRFWAFRRLVFPDQLGGALESSLTAGGLAEALEDEYEHEHETGNVTPLRRRRRGGGLGQSAGGANLRDARLSDSSEPRVSKTS